MSETPVDPAQQQLPPNTVAASQQTPPPAETTTSAAKKKKNKKKKKKKAGAAGLATDSATPEADSNQEPVLEAEMQTDQQQETVDTPVSETPEVAVSPEQTAIEVDEGVQTEAEPVLATLSQPEITATENVPETPVSHSEPEQIIETPVVPETIPESIVSAEVSNDTPQETSELIDQSVDETAAPHSAPSDSDAHASLEDESSNDSLFANGEAPLPWDQPESATTVPDSQGSNFETQEPQVSTVEQTAPVVELTQTAVDGPSLQKAPVLQQPIAHTQAHQEQEPVSQESVDEPTKIAEPVLEKSIDVPIATPEQQPSTHHENSATQTQTTSALPWETEPPSETLKETTIPSSTTVESVVPTPPQPEEAEVNPFASSSATPLPWESETPAETQAQTETTVPETKPVEEENPFSSSAATPLPWESSEPVAQPAKVEDLGSKFANLDLDDDSLLEPEATESTQKQTGAFGDVTENFASMISQNKDTTQTEEKPADNLASKFAFIDLDDEMLEDDLLPEEPVAPVPAQTTQKPLRLVQAEPAATQQRYQPAAQPQVAQPQSQFYQPVQNQFQGQQQFYQQTHQQPPAHHLDVQKLNQQKQKSDAYDFPMDLVPQKQVHRPARVLSTAQTNQQYQAVPPAMAAPMGHQPPVPMHSSTPQPPVSNPYAPRTSVSTPGVMPQQTRAQGPQGPLGVGLGLPSAPPVIKKKQSSFFEELPLPPIPVKKSRVPSSVTSMSPNMTSATPNQQYGFPPRQGMAPPAGPPKGISRPPTRPPSRPPVVAQRQGSISSVNSSPLISSSAPIVTGGSGTPNPYAPQGGIQQQNMYAPQQQQNAGGQYAPAQAPVQQLPQGVPAQSRYAPMAGASGMGGLAPPPQGHFRKPSLPGQVQLGQMPQSPQPQFSHIIDNKSPYGQAAMPGPAVPLASAQPGTYGLPQIQTSGPASYGQPSIDSAAKSPSHTAVTPSSTRYAPINHRRQQSTSAAQYDPFSAHKIQQKKIEEDQARLNAPPQHQYGQQSLAPPQPGYGHPQNQYAPQGNGMPMAPPSGPQGYTPQVSQGYAPGQPQLVQQVPQSGYPTQQISYGAPHQQSQYGGVANPIPNSEQLLNRQFPVFSWSNTSKVVSFVPSMQYGVQAGIRVMKTEEILQDASLKEFQSVSKKNFATIEKFLDGQFERVSQRHDMTATDELLLIQLLKHKISKAQGVFNLGGVLNYTETAATSSFNENFNKPKSALNKRMLVSQISNGDTKDALNLALSHQDYTLALLISSIINKESWFGIVENYLSNEFKGDQEHFLPVLFRILSGDVENVINLLSNDPQRREWAVLNWRSIATSVVTNNPPCLPQFLSMFAQFLIQNNQFIPAYIMLVLADAPVAVFPACRSVSLTLYLELYGNYLQELDLSNVFLQHAACLVDYDMLTEAQKYIDAANAAFKASKRSDPVFLYTAKCLSARLSGAGIEGGWFAKPKLDRVWGTLDKGLNKLISGDEPQQETKDNALFSKFSPSVSRSASMVSMNFGAGVDLQNQGRGQLSSSPYAPSNITGTLPPARPYIPISSSRAPSIGMGGAPQNYTPPQFSHRGSVSSSPKPTRAESTTTSPMPKTSRYAASTESGSRRSSIQSHGNAPDELMMRPPPVFGGQNGATYQPSATHQLGSPAMTSATPVFKPHQQVQQPLQPQQVPPPALVAPPPIGGPPKAGPKAGPPKTSRYGMQSGVSLDELISQERPQQQPAHVPTPPPVVAPVAVHSPPSQIAQPVAQEQQQAQISEETVSTEEAFFADESTLNHSQSTIMKPEVEESDSAPVIEDVSAAVEENVLVEQTGVDESQNEYEDDQFDPETPEKGDYFDRTAASVTQSEMGSTSATPYVVPESVTEGQHIQEDVPEEIQQKIPESNVSSHASPATPVIAAPVANPYAPPAPSQPASPYAPSPYAPGSAPVRPPMKSKASGRFTPKSYTPTADLPPVAATPVVTEDVDFYSIGGYKPSEPPQPAVPEPVAPQKVPSPVMSPVVAHQQLAPVKRNSVVNAYAPQSPVEERSRQSSVASPVNPYAPQLPAQKSYSPVKNNFNPYQPSGTADGSSRSSSLGTVPYVPSSNQESRFTPMSAASDNSNGSSMMMPNVYEPPSAQLNTYEPANVHTITSIPEGDEKFEDYVDEEDSDEEDEAPKKEPVKEREEKKQKKSKKNDDLDGKEGQGGWFGGWFKKDKNGPTVYKAKLGEANNFVYDEKLKRWVDKNATAEELQAVAAPPPPPPIIKKKPSSIGKPRSDSMSEGGPTMGGPSIASPMKAGPPMMSATPSPGPSAGGPPKKPAVSDLDSLLSAGGNSTRRKKKSGRGYVNVMGTMSGDQ